jgi:hypothetical protein
MAAAGVPMRTLQEWMGHRNLATTEIYADYAPDPACGAAFAESAFATRRDRQQAERSEEGAPRRARQPSRWRGWGSLSGSRGRSLSVDFPFRAGFGMKMI